MNQLEEAGIHIPIRHMSNSAATINFPKMHLDMVWPGTSLYSFYPGAEMAAAPTVELFPAMSVKASNGYSKKQTDCEKLIC
ncbi:MAG: alanine racemase [Clostridiaceae bacterium]|nr:alanine racemase [Clostridiaceae bacterium]